MSKNKNKDKNWVASNYDKVVLLLVLAILIGVSGFLAIRLGKSGKVSQENRKYGISAREYIMQSHTSVVSRVLDEIDVSYQIGSDSRSLFVGPLRVQCVSGREPIAYEATICPFCKTAQPTNFVTVDSDGDTLPDKWEKQHGLNPQDPSDADIDNDRDNFSNIDEYNSNTDPLDPASKPDPISKIRYTKIEVIPFKLRFLGVNRLPNGENSYQLNARTLDRTYFVTNGGTVEGWTVIGVDASNQKKTSLQLKQGDREIRLIQNEIFIDDSYRATLVSLIDKKSVTAAMRETVSVGGVNYFVMEIGLNKVLIQNTITGREEKVRKYSPLEVKSGRQSGETELDYLQKETIIESERSNNNVLKDFPTR